MPRTPIKTTRTATPTASVRMELAQDEAETAYDVADTALDELHKRGIRLPERPSVSSSRFVDADGYPEIPYNISDLNNEELGELFHIVQTYMSYVGGQLADVRNQYEVAKKKLGFISAHVRLGKDGPQKDKDVLKLIDTRYVQHDAEVTRLKCLLTLLEEVRTGIEGNVKMISRIITLQGQDLSAVQRSQAIQSKRVRDAYNPSGLDLRSHRRDPELSTTTPTKRLQKETVTRRPSRRRLTRG